MALENLAVNVSGSAADATTSLRAVRSGLADTQDEALGAAFALGRLDAQLDDAGDAAAVAGAKSGVASAGFTSLTLSTNGLALSVGTLSSTLTLSLIPALALLATTIAPITATIGAAAAAAAGLAAGFGLVLGSGIVAGLDEVKAAFAAARQEIRAILTLLGDQFTPLIIGALQRLPDLLRETIAAIGTGTLAEFAATLASLGRTVGGVIPGLVAAFVDLGRRALPLVERFVTFLAGNAQGILGSLVAVASSLSDEFAGVGDAVLSILPEITRLGTGVLSILLPALESGIRALDGFISRLSGAVDAGELQAIITAFQEAVGRPGFQRSLQAFGQNIERIFAALVQNAPAIIRGTLAIVDTVVDIVNTLTPLIVGFINLVGGALDLFAKFTRASEQTAARQDRGLARTNGSAQAINRRFAQAGQQSGRETLQNLGVNVEVVGDSQVIREIAADVTATNERLQGDRVFRETGSTSSRGN